MQNVDWVALTIFVILFIFISVLGFWAARWRRGDLDQLHEWGLGGRRFGTWVTWFLVGGDLYTAYTFIAVPALAFGAGAVAFFAVPYTILIYPILFLVFPKLWQVCHAHGYITAGDFVRGRFGNRWLALAIAVTGIVATLPYIALQLVGIQVVLAGMGVGGTGFLADLPLIIAFLILAAFTYTSGLRAPASIAIVKDVLIYLTAIVAVIVIPIQLGGFDKIFEVLLSQGRPAPELVEGHDRVQVTVRRRIIKPEVIDFIAKADQTYQLTQRERIALGLLAQHDALTARELAKALELPSVESLHLWLKRPLEWQLVHSAGRTQATRYFIDPQLLGSLDFGGSQRRRRTGGHRETPWSVWIGDGSAGINLLGLEDLRLEWANRRIRGQGVARHVLQIDMQLRPGHHEVNALERHVPRQQRTQVHGLLVRLARGIHPPLDVERVAQRHGAVDSVPLFAAPKLTNRGVTRPCDALAIAVAGQLRSTIAEHRAREIFQLLIAVLAATDAGYAQEHLVLHDRQVGGSFHLHHALKTFQHGDIKRAAAKVKHHDGTQILVRAIAVRESGRGGLVQQALHTQTRDFRGLHGGLTLLVVEIRGHRHHGAFHLLAQAHLRNAFHLL